MVTVNLSSTELWPELQSAPMAAKPSTSASAYSEGSIRVLKGLEPVKQRPGMYTRTDNPLHILQEVIDNAADEALAGYGKKIKVTLHADGSVSVEDDGRGIPFGLHPEEGAGAAGCLAFTELGAPMRESYVNLIPPTAGGTHESGLRDGLFQAVKSFIELHALLPKGVKLMPDDVFARASFVLSAKVLDPQFQGQVKEKLNSRDAVRLVSGFVKPAMELWLNAHVEHGKKLAELAIKAAQTRQKAGQKVEKRKGSGVAVLPGKLTDCESRDIADNEVFLVEGDSAGGSAKMGRNKETQAVLRCAQVLNTWEVDRDRLFANNEVHDISVAIGVDPHGPTTSRPLRPALRQDLHLERCGRGRLPHPGAAAHAVLQTLPKLIETGHVYIALPPLFRVDVPARAKSQRPRCTHWMRASSMPSSTKPPRKAWRVRSARSAASRAWARYAEQLWKPHSTPTRAACCRCKSAGWMPLPLRKSSTSSWARAKPPRAAS